MNVFGLPSPIVLGLAADLLLQILLLGLLALPLGLRRLRRSADQRFPKRTVRYAAVAVLVCVVASLRLLGGPEESAATELEETSPCAPIEDARALGLEAGSIVVDPRPPLAYAAYHLDGSCRRRIDSLDDVARAHPGATLYIADDTEFPQHALERWVDAGIDARALPGGLQAFYKPNGGAFGWGDGPRSVVSGNGDPVVIQLGPFWFMGEQRATRSLRQVPEAAAGRTGGDEIALLDLRDHGGTVPAYDAYPDRLTGPSLLVCDDPPSCLAADALGMTSPRALGKIRTLRSFDSLQASPVLPTGAFWGALALVFFLSLAAALRAPRHASWLTPVFTVALALAAPRYLGDRAFVYAVDALWLSPLLVLLLLAWLARHEAAAGRSGVALRVGVALSVVSLALIELFGQGSGGLHSAAVGAFFASFAGLLVIDMWRARGLLRPLRFADEQGGGKAERLAKVLACGVPVPRGVVVYDGYEGELEKEVARRIGAGPYVVRSSALGEDARGAATAGRYESRRDVDGASLAAATKSVRAAYASGAVLVQRQVQGEFAGVAEDAPLDLIRVEAARAKSGELLDGEGAAIAGLVSAASGWGDAPLPSEALIQCHDRVSEGASVQSEWVLSGRRLWFVQVRDVDVVALTKPEVSPIVESLRGDWVTKADQVVFDGGGLGDYDGAAAATLELLGRLLGSGPWRDDAEHLLGLRLPRPDPALVRFGGRLYSNRVPSRPVRTALSLPWRRLRLWWLRRRKSAALTRIHGALANAAQTEGKLDDAAPPAIALSLLASLCDAEASLAGDPYLEALARGEITDGEYSGRAMPDLALRLPREGRAPKPEVPALAGSFDEDLARLRGVARCLLAHHVSEYRNRPGLDLQAEPVEALPLTLTLPQLERYALDGTSGVAKHAEAAGVWIGPPAPGKYVVGETLTLVDVPTPRCMADAPVGQLVVARRGSRLCHGALVAKERGVPALFAVGDVDWADGCSVTLDVEGAFTSEI